MINSQKIQRLVIATAFASALLSAGVAASAQTTAAPANPGATAPNGNVVAVSTVDTKSKRQAELEQENADARRVEFRLLGTSM